MVVFFVGSIYRKEARRVTDEPLFYLMLTECNGFVPRDYFNLELRHHQMLDITFILLVLFSIRWQKYTIFSNPANF